MLKRFVSSLVGVACLVSMTGAFATASYTGTTTEYDVSGKIRVKSTISGTTGDTVTYLVHDDDADVATLQDGQVVYVDQYEFTGDEANGTYTFNYLTDTTDIGATVLVGGDIENAIVDDTVGKVVTVNGVKEYVADAAGTNGYVLVPCNVIGNIVTEVKLGDNVLDAEEWFVAADGLYITGLALDGTDVVTFAAAETEAVSVATLDAAFLAAGEMEDQSDDAAGYASILAVGQVTGQVDEFGILITVDSEKYYLPALGKNAAGMYAIRAYNETLTDGTGITVQAYYKNGEQTIVADQASSLITL